MARTTKKKEETVKTDFVEEIMDDIEIPDDYSDDSYEMDIEKFQDKIKELQALALDVKILDDKGGEIELKQNFDDEELSFGAIDNAVGEYHDDGVYDGMSVGELTDTEQFGTTGDEQDEFEKITGISTESVDDAYRYLHGELHQ